MSLEEMGNEAIIIIPGLDGVPTGNGLYGLARVVLEVTGRGESEITSTAEWHGPVAPRERRAARRSSRRSPNQGALDPGPRNPSARKERLILLGLRIQFRVLVVCHCHREAESLVRIISARKADRLEQEAYWS